jgi:hypothetical protein
VARGRHIRGSRVVLRSAGAFPCCEELHQRVRLAEREHLALTQLPDECLSGERRAAEQGTERDLGSVPSLDQIGGEVLRMARDIETRHDRPDSVQRIEGGPLVRRRHLTIRSNPASALPRMKLSGSAVEMSMPVTAY